MVMEHINRKTYEWSNIGLMVISTFEPVNLDSLSKNFSHSQPLFLYFRLSTVHWIRSVTSVFGSDRSVN